MSNTSSDPRSLNFGKHLSTEDVTDMFAPSKESIDTVSAQAFM